MNCFSHCFICCLKNIDFINMVDLNILLGNMLDNAIEAVNSLPEENRVIDLKLHTDDHFFRITEKNTFSGSVNINQDGLVSSKPENGYHGFGSQSMKYIVDRYNGQMALDVNENVFILHVIIPMPSDKTL